MRGGCHSSELGATPTSSGPDWPGGFRAVCATLTCYSRGMHGLSLILEPATEDDAEPIERLNERVFGPGRFARAAYRIRETTDPDPALSFVARVGTLLVGASAMTPIAIGDAPALLLGPLIVEPVFRSQGIGEALVMTSLEAAKGAGWKLVILVGDEPYYARMGFRRIPTGHISLPGPVDPERLLYCELEPGALAVAKGAARGA
jgi:predicted N-acetyltransferase YhbS